MRRQVRQTLWALGLALALPFGAMAQSWDNIAMISATLGNTLGRVCIGAANADVGCPTYAPSLTSGGLLTATSIATGDAVGPIAQCVGKCACSQIKDSTDIGRSYADGW